MVCDTEQGLKFTADQNYVDPQHQIFAESLIILRS